MHKCWGKYFWLFPKLSRSEGSVFVVANRAGGGQTDKLAPNYHQCLAFLENIKTWQFNVVCFSSINCDTNNFVDRWPDYKMEWFRAIVWRKGGISPESAFFLVSNLTILFAPTWALVVMTPYYRCASTFWYFDHLYQYIYSFQYVRRYKSVFFLIDNDIGTLILDPWYLILDAGVELRFWPRQG